MPQNVREGPGPFEGHCLAFVAPVGFCHQPRALETHSVLCGQQFVPNIPNQVPQAHRPGSG